MKFKASQIAQILQGEIIGNAEQEVFKLSKIEEGTTGSLTFLANSLLLMVSTELNILSIGIKVSWYLGSFIGGFLFFTLFIF